MTGTPRSGLTRRRFVTLTAMTAGGAVVATVGGLAATGMLAAGEPGVLLRTDRPLPPRFQTPLPIPPVARPVRSDATGDHYEITQTVAPVRVFPDVTTPMWTY